METVLKISGMSCNHCVRAVESALKSVPGLHNVRVSVGEASVTTDGPVDMVVLRKALEDEGYHLA